MAKTIVMICSPMPQCGKDTIADYMVDKYNFKKYCFAEKVKEIAKFLGWDGKKDTVGRSFLKTIAEAPKAYNKRIWADKITKELAYEAIFYDRKYFVVSDLRFMEELNAIDDMDADKIIIAIEREGDEFTLDEGDKTQREYREIVEQKNIKVIKINNDSTVEDLHNKIDDIMMSRGAKFE